MHKNGRSIKMIVFVYATDLTESKESFKNKYCGLMVFYMLNDNITRNVIVWIATLFIENTCFTNAICVAHIGMC